MDIAVIGRHTDIADRFRRHAEDKLEKVTQLAPAAQRVEVKVTHESNPRLAGVSERVELTVFGKGPVVRAEAAADDRYGALDVALDKLSERLRRAHGKRTRSRRRGETADIADVDPLLSSAPGTLESSPAAEADDEPPLAPQALGETVEFQRGGSPVVIRNKLHHAVPMSVDDAIDEMEFVGHDFFLFIDIDTSRPSVAYRRRGWTYGVIGLDATCANN